MSKKDNRANNIKGIVFHIIHGSFVDGHGVRTTVFLKGCPLRCLWCCNPEGQLGQLELKFTASECNGCGRCVQVCPSNAILLNPKSGDDKLKINRELCTNCGKCIEVCYTGALDYFGKYMTVEELFDIVRRDEKYYQASGGGVSIGGGEPTIQPAFTYALLRKCKDSGIHVAMDTCGYIATEEGLKILKEADLLLYDLKGIDPKQHLINTGVSNEIILKNLESLNAMKKPIIIRVPLIPGHVDSKQNIKAIAEFVSKLKSVERVDLLAYHNYGAVKYEQLGKAYRLNGLKTQSQEQLDDIKYTFERYGLTVQLGG